MFAGDLLSHARRQLRDLPNDRKTLTFTRCDCLSVCLCLISLPLLVGSSTARRQIDSAGCKQRGLIGVVTICLPNPPSNRDVFSKGEPLLLPLEKALQKKRRPPKQRKGRKGASRPGQGHGRGHPLLPRAGNVRRPPTPFVHENTRGLGLRGGGPDASGLGTEEQRSVRAGLLFLSATLQRAAGRQAAAACAPCGTRPGRAEGHLAPSCWCLSDARGRLCRSGCH